ncbi:hypothetical protein [Nocardia wallacei]|uniref:hypothetical protein n=1 Tax=Nocardia wallacei TaxID=480035 RepID=UPI0024578BD7|nr:hypothetical protein [Nocardia wallacei]
MTVPATEGFQAMAVRVLVWSEAEMDSVASWVCSFEPVSCIGSCSPEDGAGQISFFAEDLEQYHRLVDYVASWNGEALHA